MLFLQNARKCEEIVVFDAGPLSVALSFWMLNALPAHPPYFRLSITLLHMSTRPSLASLLGKFFRALFAWST
jgi:hypothetical protein